MHVNANVVLKATGGWISGTGVISAEERVPTVKEAQCKWEREEARVNHEGHQQNSFFQKVENVRGVKPAYS